MCFFTYVNYFLKYSFTAAFLEKEKQHGSKGVSFFKLFMKASRAFGKHSALLSSAKTWELGLMLFLLPRVVHLIPGRWGNEAQGGDDSAATTNRPLKTPELETRVPTFFCGDKGVTWALPYKPLVPWGLMETAHSRGLWVAEPKDTKKDSSVFRGWFLPLGTKHICQNFEVERKTTSSAPKANPCSASPMVISWVLPLKSFSDST